MIKNKIAVIPRNHTGCVKSGKFIKQFTIIFDQQIWIDDMKTKIKEKDDLYNEETDNTELEL